MNNGRGQVLVATCSHEAACLNRTLTDTMRRLLRDNSVLDERWLWEGEAWELRFSSEGVDSAHFRKQAQLAAIGLPVDINIVPDLGVRRRKRLLVADMESTIIQQECIDEIADLAGRGEEVASLTLATMRGEFDFQESLETRVAMLKGLPASAAEAVLERLSLMPGARSLVETMQAHGAFCALVTSGFTMFAQAVADALGFDDVRANALEIVDGVISGRVVEPVIGPEGKLETLKAIAKRLKIPLKDTLAVGDGANDLAMIKAAGLGVAYRAKPVVAEGAKVKLRHSDLRALLFLQGYSRREIAC